MTYKGIFPPENYFPVVVLWVEYMVLKGSYNTRFAIGFL